jgi:hypothetical protein
MTYARTSIPDFSVANKLYVNAVVTAYTVDSNGVKTTTKATLYAAPTGSTTLTNPQILDSYGKFKSPVYVGQRVILTISGLRNTPDHDTGIVADGDVAQYANAAAASAAAAAASAASLDLPATTNQDGRGLAVKWDGSDDYEFRTMQDKNVVFVRDMPSFVGDGTSDEAPAINEAVAALGTRGGKVVFPFGAMTISTPVSDGGKPVHFIGMGAGGSADVAGTVIRPGNSSVQGFRFTAYNSIVEGVYFDGSPISGASPLANITPTSIAIFVGYSATAIASPITSSNARHCGIRDVVINYWPGTGIHWSGGSHLQFDRVRIFCAHNYGIFIPANSNDAAHGNFSEVQISFCRPWGIHASSWSHRFKHVKAFNCGNPYGAGGGVYIGGDSWLGNIYMEQSNGARETVTFTAGTKVINISNFFALTAKEGMVVDASGYVPANTFIDTIDRTTLGSCTITLTQNMTTNGSALLSCYNIGASKVPAVELAMGASFNDGMTIDGDALDPNSIKFAKTDSSNYGASSICRAVDQGFFAFHRCVTSNGFQLALNDHAGSYDLATEMTFQADVTSGSSVISNVPDDVFDHVRTGCDVSAPEITASTSTNVNSVDRAAGTITVAATSLTTKANCWIRLRGHPSVGGIRMQSWDDKKFMMTGSATSGANQLWLGGSGVLCKGTITSGSNSITSVQKSDVSSAYVPQVGMEVHCPLFPDGTLVTAVTGTVSTGYTVTCDNVATATDCAYPIYFNFAGSTLHLGWNGGLREFNTNQLAMNNIQRSGLLYKTSDGYVRIANTANTNGNEASTTWDPASIASGSSLASSDIAVANAVLNDFVQVSCSRDLQGLVATGYVSSNGNVKIVLANLTGGAIDIGSSTFKVRINRPN